jgi:hypothetical protein
VAGGQKSTSRTGAPADLEKSNDNRPAKAGNKLASWIPGRDKEPPERKPQPLPLSDSSAVASDDEQVDP